MQAQRSLQNEEMRLESSDSMLTMAKDIQFTHQDKLSGTKVTSSTIGLSRLEELNTFAHTMTMYYPLILTTGYLISQ